MKVPAGGPNLVGRENAQRRIIVTGFIALFGIATRDGSMPVSRTGGCVHGHIRESRPALPTGGRGPAARLRNRAAGGGLGLTARRGSAGS